jgi:hypothetical protein
MYLFTFLSPEPDLKKQLVPEPVIPDSEVKPDIRPDNIFY